VRSARQVNQYRQGWRALGGTREGGAGYRRAEMQYRDENGRNAQPYGVRGVAPATLPAACCVRRQVLACAICRNGDTFATQINARTKPAFCLQSAPVYR